MALYEEQGEGLEEDGGVADLMDSRNDDELILQISCDYHMTSIFAQNYIVYFLTLFLLLYYNNCRKNIDKNILYHSCHDKPKRGLVYCMGLTVGWGY